MYYLYGSRPGAPRRLVATFDSEAQLLAYVRRATLSEYGGIRGTIEKKITSEITFKGYTVHASKEEPQFLIKSDKTDHMAMHKGSALKKLKKRTS